MLISASTACFPEIGFPEVIEQLIDLEFAAIEVAIHDDGTQLTSEQIVSAPEECLRIVRDSHRLDITAYDLRIAPETADYFDRFAAVCHFAKATKVVTINVPSSPQGTPFNEEIERLQRLVNIASDDGIRVAVKNQLGCISEDPDTIKSLCDYVTGLGVDFDPSHHLCSNAYRNRGTDKLLPHIYNVRLRDSKKDQLQVRIGQGQIEYGRLITSLQQRGYDRALCADILPGGDVDVRQELRKLRLLLESSL